MLFPLLVYKMSEQYHGFPMETQSYYGLPVDIHFGFPYTKIFWISCGYPKYHGFPMENCNIVIFPWKQEYPQLPTFHCYFLTL